MAERPLIRGPVLEVDGSPEPFAQTLREGTPGAVADGLVPGLEVVDAWRKEDRQARRQYQVVESTVGMVGDPVPLFLVDHVSSPLDGDARRARVDHQEPGPSEVAVVRPPGRGRLAIPLPGQRAQARSPVLVIAQVVQERLLRELGGRQVSDVLVEPVRHEGSRDSILPPRQPAHLFDPGVGDVPVVVDVVIVEDHGARHRRQQPADIGVRP